MKKFDNNREEWFQDPPYNLVEIFENGAEKFKDLPSLGIKNESGIYEWITHGEIANRVDNLRGGLAQIGINKDDVVGIIKNNSVEFPVIAQATYGRSGWFIPMYEQELLSVWKYIIKDSKMKIVFVANNEIYNKLNDSMDELPSLEKIILIDGESEHTMAGLEELGKANPVESIKPNKDDIAGLIYTSGTTGDPKGVLISHGNYASMIKIVRDSFSTFDHNTKSFSILPWAHVFGQVGELYHGSVIGGCCGLMGSRETLLEDIVKIKPNTLIAVPRIFNTIYHGIYAKMAATGGIVEKLFHTAVKEAVKKRETGKASFKLKLLDKIVFEKIRQMFGGELKYAITGSAVMNTDIKMFFQDLGIETWDGYGLTESSLALSFNGPIYGNEMGSVGKPGKFITLKIDKTLTGPDSKDGEIIAYGPNIMQGYLNKPEKTAQVMTEDGGFRTGDKGWLDEKGFLHITGRIKEEYKLSNGKYVHPASIEEEIKLSPLITNAFISGAGKDYNVALVVPDPMAIKNIAEAKNIPVEDPQELIKMEEIQNMLNNTITNQLKGTYGNYEIPKKIKYITEEFSLENGLLTQTLKLKRNKIIEKYGNDLNNLYD